MLTQIYEVSTPEEALAVSAIGVDHIGILVGRGDFPRELRPVDAAAVAASVSAPSKVSALFLCADLEFIAETAAALRPHILHLGAASELLSPAGLAGLKRRLPGMAIMRSVPVIGEESLAIAAAYDGVADYLLLDSHRASDRQVGALGITHDWSISRRIVAQCRTPVILAGGLGPDNVSGAIAAVGPAGVDSKTKTDVQGSHAKDLDRVRRFQRSAKDAATSAAAGPAS